MGHVEVQDYRRDSKSTSTNSGSWFSSHGLGIGVVILTLGVLVSCSGPAPVTQEDKAPKSEAVAPPSPFTQFGSGACEVSGLTGFYPAENWGAWSNQDPSEIILKSPLNGAVKMDITAYTVAQHELKVSLGDVSKTITLLAAQPKRFTLEYNLSAPVQKIILSGVKPRSIKTDSRMMAVGLLHVDCNSPTTGK